MPKKETVYAIQCFKDGKRRFTCRMSKKDAKFFKKTAKHLVKFLKKNYGV